MSEVYNPEVSLLEQLEKMELEAGTLSKRLVQSSGEARQLIRQDMEQIERRIHNLRRFLKRAELTPGLR